MSIQIFQLIVLLFSAIIHEYMHGWAANAMGDSTAKDMGRLTLNPAVHIDPFGTILLPLMLFLSNSPFFFGWAKPVPFNPYNLNDQKYGPAKVALAGPMSNFFLALVFGLMIRFFGVQLGSVVAGLLTVVVLINLILGVFNILPIPPLDGSKIIMPLLPFYWQEKLARLEQYGMILVILFVIFGFSIIWPIIGFLFTLITGQQLF